MELKHVIFFAGFLIGVPFLVVLLRTNQKYQKAVFVLMIFSIPFVNAAGISFFGDPGYRGTVRGFEITLTDLLSLSLILTFISLRHKFKFRAPGGYFYLLYFLLSVISIFNSDSIYYSGYELMKMTMMYLLFLASYNYIHNYRDINIVVYALSAIIVYNFFVMLQQKYLYGYYQPGGLFSHRNSTSMFVNLFAPVILSLVLNKHHKRGKFYLFLSIYAICALSIFFALSRGAVFFFPVAAAIVTSFSLANKITARKIQIVFLFLIVVIIGSAKVAPRIVERFETASPTSANTRVRLAGIAVRMANDRFFGVGLNNWGIKVNPPYTYSDVNGIPYWQPGDKDGLVETIYLLVAAECGWIGLASLLAWFGYYFVQNILNIWRYRKTNVQYISVGILAGLIAVYGQSSLEWVLKQSPNFYELMVIFAVVAAMTQNYREYKKAQKKHV